MSGMDSNPTLVALGAGAVAAGLALILRRLELSRAKHPSLAGHARLSRRVARLIPFYEYEDAQFFAADGAPPAVADRRRAAFEALEALYRQRFARGAALSAQARERISDLQFTRAYRVPFQFSRRVRESLDAGNFVRSAAGVRLVDVDGNEMYDLTGSYGVNVFGHDFYRECLTDGASRTGAMAVVLGAYHPVVADNARRLCEISGQDEVSFHMSGTEAVMQAVRLARYHTGRSHLVRFCGAYHGWWGDVQPGVGNPQVARDTYTLADMDDASLRVLRRRRDIACVLVNPLQALHPNASAPSDGALMDGGRRARFDRAAYTAWLRRLRDVCTERGIVLVFDEVFLGFRLGRTGAQGYFGVAADMVTYGKTVAGGLPVGVLCGRRDLMKRYRDDRPADVCFARGTFNAHPQVMGTMAAFLDRLDTPVVAGMYDDLDARWNARAERLNERLAAAGLPVRVENLSSVWTVTYGRPSRYNWMLQYYLRAEGLALSWVGTGRIIFSLDFSEADFQEVVGRFQRAAERMEADGWWWTPAGATNRGVRRRILGETLVRRLKG